MIPLLIALIAVPCVPSGALFWPVDVVEQCQVVEPKKVIAVEPESGEDPEAVLMEEQPNE